MRLRNKICLRLLQRHGEGNTVGRDRGYVLYVTSAKDDGGRTVEWMEDEKLSGGDGRRALMAEKGKQLALIYVFAPQT